MIINKQDIESALQQFLGFKIGKGGYGIRELVSSMGLKKEEWEHIKKNEDSGNLYEEDIEEIDEIFAVEKENVA